MDDEELEKLAVEEILKETKRGAERAKEQGALGWQKCPLPATNKRFLKSMLVGTLRNLDNRKRKYNNYDHDYSSKRRDQWKTRRRNSDYDYDREYDRDYDREERSVRNHRDKSKLSRHSHGKDKDHKKTKHRSKHKKDSEKKDKKHRSKKKSSKKHKKKDSEKTKS